MISQSSVNEYDALLQIRSEIEHHQIKIFQFSDCDSDDDSEWTRQDYEMRVS